MATVTIVAPAGNLDLSATASYSIGALPSADDILEFRGPNNGGTTRWTITAGHTALAAIDLQRVRFYPGVEISTGATALSLLVSNVTTLAAPIVEFGAATFGQFNLTSAGAIDNLLVSNPGATINATGGSIPVITVDYGSLTVESGVTATTGYNFGGRLVTYPNFTTAQMDMGEWRAMAGTITTGRIDGNGRMTMLGAAAATTMNLHGSGHLAHQSTGTIATANLYASSVYDPTNAPVNPTVTNVNIFGKRPSFYSQSGSVQVTTTTVTGYAGGKVLTKG